MMNEFMMLFRHVPNPGYQPSPEDIQATITKWQDWIGNIAAKGQFSSTNKLGFEGKTLRPDGTLTDGPYAELKEIVGGYVIVKANTLDEAVALANGCPILTFGGHVEIRNIMTINA